MNPGPKPSPPPQGSRSIYIGSTQLPGSKIQAFKDLIKHLGLQMAFTKQYSDELSVNESEKRIMFPIKTHGLED